MFAGMEAAIAHDDIAVVLVGLTDLVLVTPALEVQVEALTVSTV
jgi:hypothetical protein